MMALEETFDLQLDEEGTHVLALIIIALRPDEILLMAGKRKESIAV